MLLFIITGEMKTTLTLSSIDFNFEWSSYICKVLLKQLWKMTLTKILKKLDMNVMKLYIALSIENSFKGNRYQRKGLLE